MNAGAPARRAYFIAIADAGTLQIKAYMYTTLTYKVGTTHVLI